MEENIDKFYLNIFPKYTIVSKNSVQLIKISTTVFTRNNNNHQIVKLLKREYTVTANMVTNDILAYLIIMTYLITLSFKEIQFFSFINSPSYSSFNFVWAL